MAILLFIILFVILSIISVAVYPKVWFWTLIGALTLLLGHTLGVLGVISGGLFGALFLIPAILLNIPLLRQRLISKHILALFNRLQPKISQTEEEALNAGDTWWEQDLFQGDPDWQKFNRITLSQLTKEETAFLDHETTALCNMVNIWQTDFIDKKLPKKVIDFIRQKGFLGFLIDKNYGGKQFSAAANSRTTMKIASASSFASMLVGVSNSLGPGELILHYGDEQQKKHYLPLLAKGKMIPCFGLTATTAGSDATSLIDRGIVTHAQHQGKKTLGLRLNFNKRYITLAPIADLIGVAIKVFDPNHLLSDKEARGITCCLVEANTPGVTIGNRHRPHGTPWYNGPIEGKDVFIPLTSIIGGEKMIGNGWHMLNECLSIGRSFSVPTLASASAIAAYLGTSAYARIREQFNVPIGYFEGVQEKMAEMGGLLYLMDSTLAFNIAAVDSGIKPSVASAIGKYHVSELSRIVINHGMDIHGGRGIMDGPSNYLSLAYDNIPSTITVEGANIMTRNLIIFGQGMTRCHPYLYDEIKASRLTNPKEALITFDALIFSHLGYMLNRGIKAGVRGITLGYFISVPKHPLRRQLQHISRLSTALSITSEATLMVLGGSLKFRERLSARLGDVLSYLYMASAVVKYLDTHNNQKEEMIYARWSIDYCLFNAQKALFDFYDNFPNRWLARGLKWRLFPFGKTLNAPTDGLSQQIALHMMKPSTLRNRFKHYLHIPDDTTHPLGLIEETFHQILKTEALYKKLKQAIKAGSIPGDIDMKEKIQRAEQQAIFSQHDAKQLQEAEALRWQALQVDVFDQNLDPLKPKSTKK